ncbi:DUF4345 family protein [Nocardia jejuensis]|uniref:DUF4345 family protein n=1 Tax=Nocardia jejuensis TaxID=328049 RepID=UPI000A066E4C|nr:DUF4345 family protein [Nocardia jejuensis]
MATVTSVIVAVFFLGMGVYALASPAAIMAPFGIGMEDPRARYEVRAVYGGFGIAMAGILAIAATHDGELRSGIMATVGVALGGMAAGRAVAAVLDQRVGWYPNWFYFVVEAVAAAALLLTM